SYRTPRISAGVDREILVSQVPFAFWVLPDVTTGGETVVNIIVVAIPFRVLGPTGLSLLVREETANIGVAIPFRVLGPTGQRRCNMLVGSGQVGG
ncbi:MAG: hypothetical protein NZ483_09530, partial [Verrucomicrobiae bacterium]|nr:hypothetical protein [Verrucomicrobiae bacterium]